MIISHKHRFIFIKTIKTAGTSLEAFLSPLCGEDDILTPIHPAVEPHRARNYRGFANPWIDIANSKGAIIFKPIKRFFRRIKYYNHITAINVRPRLPANIWDGYTKFCIERNPWDKTVSHYHMVRVGTKEGMTFDQYLERNRFCRNIHFYTDNGGKVIIDRILRYESLDGDLSELFAEMKIPFDGQLGVWAKSEHRTDKRPYQEMYTDQQKRTIEEAFAQEISLHDYKF